MVKIPELPGNYRPGDVVNGFVLTTRGHWVPVDNARAEGLKLRYLGSAVSTVHDPDKPSSEIPRRQAQGPAAQRSPSSATPPSNPYLSARGKPPPTQGGPTPPRRGCVGCLAVGIIAIAAVVVFGLVARTWFADLSAPAPTPEWSLDLDEDWADVDVEIPVIAPPEIPSPEETPSFRLSEEESALFEVTEWEVWHSEYSSHFVLTVAAPGLERPRAGVSVHIEAVDATGVTHEASDFIALRHGEPTVSVGFFSEAFDAEITELRAEFVPLGVWNEPEDYEVMVLEGSVDTTASRPQVEVTIAAEGAGEPPSNLRLTAVVRDADGAILNLGVAYPAPPEPGARALIEFPLWGPETVSGTDDWQFTVLYQ